MTDAQIEEMFGRILSKLPKNGRSPLPVVTAILIALAPTLASTAAWLTAKAAETQAKSAQTQTAATHALVNSRMDELLRLTRAQGLQDGRDEETPPAHARPTVARPGDAGLAKELMEMLKKYEEKK